MLSPGLHWQVVIWGLESFPNMSGLIIIISYKAMNLLFVHLSIVDLFEGINISPKPFKHFFPLDFQT